jgi:hypothetical protein
MKRGREIRREKREMLGDRFELIGLNFFLSHILRDFSFLFELHQNINLIVKDFIVIRWCK